MDEWTDGQMTRKPDGRMNERVDKLMDEWTDGRAVKRMERMDG
jgi:hypothetical protein